MEANLKVATAIQAELDKVDKTIKEPRTSKRKRPDTADEGGAAGGEPNAEVGVAALVSGPSDGGDEVVGGSVAFKNVLNNVDLNNYID